MRVGVSKKVQCTCFSCFTSTKGVSSLALLVQKYLAGEGLEKGSVRGWAVYGEGRLEAFEEAGVSLLALLVQKVSAYFLH